VKLNLMNDQHVKNVNYSLFGERENELKEIS